MATAGGAASARGGGHFGVTIVSRSDRARSTLTGPRAAGSFRAVARTNTDDDSAVDGFLAEPVGCENGLG